MSYVQSTFGRLDQTKNFEKYTGQIHILGKGTGASDGKAREFLGE
jgi:hypothetical protein